MVGVSVAVPVWNEGPRIEGAIRSLLQQTRPIDELIVCDNDSTDDTAEVAARLLGAEAVIRRPENVGAVANFNLAVRETTEPYFSWFGGDDLMHPEFIRRTAEVLDADPDVEACTSFTDYFVTEDGERLPYVHSPEINSPDPRTRIRAFVRRHRWTEVYSLFRREALLSSPMFVDSFAGDVRLGWWFVLRGTIRVIEEPLLELRRDNRDRTPAGQVRSMNPKRRAKRFPRWRFWWHLWFGAAQAGVPRRVTRIARGELIRALFHYHWRWFLIDDVVGPKWHGRLTRVAWRLRVRL